MSQEDYEFVCRVRDGDVERNWNEIPAKAASEKNGGETELARFNYYDGKNPGWPEQILRAEYGWALQHIEDMRNDERSQAERIERLRVRTLGDQEIVIHFEFGQPVDEHERRDVTACLANLFQQLKYVSLEPSPDDQPDSPVSAIPTDDLDD